MKSKQAFFGNGSNISFPNSKIQFNSINVDEDIFDVYILYNNKKLQNLNSSSPNYYRIYAKDIGVADDFKELNFMVVNNIELKINMILLKKVVLKIDSNFLIQKLKILKGQKKNFIKNIKNGMIQNTKNQLTKNWTPIKN